MSAFAGMPTEEIDAARTAGNRYLVIEYHADEMTEEFTSYRTEKDVPTPYDSPLCRRLAVVDLEAPIEPQLKDYLQFEP